MKFGTGLAETYKIVLRMGAPKKVLLGDKMQTGIFSQKKWRKIKENDF